MGGFMGSLNWTTWCRSQISRAAVHLICSYSRLAREIFCTYSKFKLLKFTIILVMNLINVGWVPHFLYFLRKILLVYIVVLRLCILAFLFELITLNYSLVSMYIVSNCDALHTKEWVSVFLSSWTGYDIPWELPLCLGSKRNVGSRQIGSFWC